VREGSGVGIRQSDQGHTDLMHNSLQAIHHVRVSETENRIARILHCLVPPPIMCQPHVMTIPVDLHNQSPLLAKKIGEVRPYRHLPAELAAFDFPI